MAQILVSVAQALVWAVTMTHTKVYATLPNKRMEKLK